MRISPTSPSSVAVLIEVTSLEHSCTKDVVALMVDLVAKQHLQRRLKVFYAEIHREYCESSDDLTFCTIGTKITYFLPSCATTADRQSMAGGRRSGDLSKHLCATRKKC